MTFKLAHLSDFHSGYRSGRRLTAEGVNLREQDGYDAMEEIVNDVINEGCDAAVFCGDTMHVSGPDIRALITVQNLFRKLADAGVKVYALAGNHDTSDVRADIAASQIFNDPDRGIFSHSEPYVKYEIAPGITLHMVSHHMYGDQAHTMSLIKPTEGHVNIFTTHGSVIDPLLQAKLTTEQSPREIVIPDFLFADYNWDYALLGHIHERGWVGSSDKVTDTLGKKMFYNGSIIRRGFSDKEVPLGRGWTKWEIEGDGTMTPEIRKVHQRTQTDFATIDAKNLTPSDITDRILASLRDSQTDGRNFIESEAPMLRQRIKNFAPVKQAALDHASIAAEAAHSFSWSIKPINTESNANSDSEIHMTDVSKAVDAVQIFDMWIDNSEKLKSASDGVRDSAKKSAREYVEAGQEKVLND